MAEARAIADSKTVYVPFLIYFGYFSGVFRCFQVFSATCGFFVTAKNCAESYYLALYQYFFYSSAQEKINLLMAQNEELTKKLQRAKLDRDKVHYDKIQLEHRTMALDHRLTEKDKIIDSLKGEIVEQAKKLVLKEQELTSKMNNILAVQWNGREKVAAAKDETIKLLQSYLDKKM
jgi:uncharacterized coiled-coil protein SlyX